MSGWPPPNLKDYIHNLVIDSHHPPENVQNIIRDIFDCCRQFNGLKPRLEAKPSNTSTQKLVVVDGVIPVTYRGVQYYIPIMIQLPRHYPNEPPVPYVKPTTSMVIRERHRHVTSDGRVHISHYLDVWNPPNYSLYGLVVAMIKIFATNPPVNSRPTSNTSKQQLQQQQQQQRPQYSHQQFQQSQYHQQFQQSQPYQFQQSQQLDLFKSQQEEREKRELKWKLTEKLSGRFSDTHTESIVELVTQSDRKIKFEQNVKELKNLNQKEKENYETLKCKHDELIKQEQKLSTWKMNTVDKITDEQKQNIDSLLQFQDITIHQIAQCIAEDYAINDTMEQIDEAFVKNIIDHDKYLKDIRNLSRKQFYPRALKQKLEIQHNEEYKAAKEAAYARQNAANINNHIQM